MPITIAPLLQISPSTLAIINQSAASFPDSGNMWFFGGYIYFIEGEALFQYDPVGLSVKHYGTGTSTITFSNVTYNGTYLYATMNNGTMLKIDPTNMSLVSTSTGTTFALVIYDGTNLYAGLTNGNIAIVDQTSLDIVSSTAVTTNSLSGIMLTTSLRYGVSWAFPS